MAITRIGLNQSINLASNVTGTLPTANGGTGATSFTAAKVLQVVTSVPTSSFSTTSTSLVDTPYSITITPTATNSKMIVEFSGNWGKGDATGRNQLQVQTNSSGSYAAIKTASYLAWTGSGDTAQGTLDTVRVIESPIGTTNAVTYKLQAKIISSSQTVYVPLNNNDASLATVYEIAG
tara:strand:- start:308 stop:841 length:534 start_codon:yes stop_codon:yes gene_type:complete